MSEQVEKLVVELEAKVDSFNRDLRNAQRTQSQAVGDINRRMDQYNKTAGNVTKSNMAFKASLVAVGVSAAVAGAKLVQYLSESVTVAKEFNTSVSQLSAITGATGDDLDFMAEAAKRFGSTTTLSASQAATAFKLVASAKPDLLENREALAMVTKEAITLAEAATMELAPAADALGNSLNQFGADADQASRYINVLAAGSKFGSSSIEQTNEALKNSGVAAASAKLSFEETNAAIQTLASVGLKGSEAGTALRAVLTKLDTAVDKQLRPSVVGFDKALANLAAKEMDTAQIVKFFGAEHQSAARILMENRGQVEQLTKSLTGTATAYEQASTNTDNFEGDLKGLASASEGLQIELGNMLIETLDLRGGTQDLTAAIQDFISAGGGIEKVEEFLIGLRRVVEDVYDYLSVYAEQWSIVFGSAGEEIGKLGGTFSKEISYVMDLLNTLWKFVSDTFIALPATIAATVQTAVGSIKLLVYKAAELVLGLAEKLENLPLVGDSVKEAIGEVREGMQELIKEEIESEKEAIAQVWAKRDAIVEAAQEQLEAKREAREIEREEEDAAREEELEKKQEFQEKLDDLDKKTKKKKEKEDKKDKKQKDKETKDEVKDKEKLQKQGLSDYLKLLEQETSAASGASETVHKINQGAAAAQTLMSTPAAVMKAYEQLGPIGGSIAAAGIIATGLQAVNQIRSITSDGGGGGSMGGGSIDTSGSDGAIEATESIETSAVIADGGAATSTNFDFQASGTDELGKAMVGWLNSAIKKGQVKIG